jgi:hypothetical protein
MDFGIDVIEAFKTYGIIPTVALILLYALKSYFWTFVMYLWGKTFGKKKKTGELSKHPAFHQMENYVAVRIPGIHFEDKGRGEVFRDMLTVMFRSYIDMMRKVTTESFDKDGEPIFTSNDDLIQKLSNYGVQAIKEYEDQWRKMGVPLICIIKFNEWHSNKRDILFTDIQTIANSSFHATYNEKIASFFDLIFMVLNISILDAEYILKDLNGELSGQTYKGIEIGHGEPTCVIRNRDDESSVRIKVPYTKKKSEIINFREEEDN